MRTHGCPLLHTFAMMEHQPQSCQIPSWLHTFSIDVINKTIHGHLEQEALKITLPN